MTYVQCIYVFFWYSAAISVTGAFLSKTTEATGHAATLVAKLNGRRFFWMLVMIFMVTASTRGHGRCRWVDLVGFW